MRAGQTHFLNVGGKYEQALLLVQDAIATAETAEDPLIEILGFVNWGHALFRLGQSDEARRHFVRALQLIDAAAEPVASHELVYEAEAYTLGWLGWIDANAGDYAAGRASFEQALQLCQRLGKRQSECLCRNSLGEIAMIMGDYAAANASFHAGLRLAREHGARPQQGVAQMALGMVAVVGGDYGRAQEALTGALAVFRDIGDRMFEAYVLAYLGRLADSLGQYGLAKERLEQALRLSQEVQSWETQLYSLLFLALTLHHRGEHAAAYAAAEHGWQIATSAGDRSRQAEARVMLGRAREGMQQLVEASLDYQQALLLYEQLGRTHLSPEPLSGLARVALAQGNTEQALSAVEAILRLLETGPLLGPEEPFRVYLTCCQVLQTANDPRAVEVRRIAQQQLHGQADRIIDAAERQAFLQQVATHRELLRDTD